MGTINTSGVSSCFQEFMAHRKPYKAGHHAPFLIRYARRCIIDLTQEAQRLLCCHPEVVQQQRWEICSPAMQ